jgi:hypothetical protein
MDRHSQFTTGGVTPCSPPDTPASLQLAPSRSDHVWVKRSELLWSQQPTALLWHSRLLCCWAMQQQAATQGCSRSWRPAKFGLEVTVCILCSA